MSNTYGYIRVSSRDQNEDRQRIAMRDAGVEDARIYMDKQSGKDFDRPGYRRLLKKLKPGDTLIIKSIDRLGRNYDEILEQWRLITKEKQAAIVVLDMPLLDTRQGRDLTGTLIADIVLQLLSYVAQTEREFILQRQAEGIAAAKKRGVHFGRKPMERPARFDAVVQDWEAGKLSSRAAAHCLQISHTTFLRWVKEPVMQSTPCVPMQGDLDSDT
jgi:DNA invertase Pin-like site-specific DNA recombinase